MKSLLVAVGHRLFRWREVLFPTVQLALVFATPPRPWFGGGRGDLLADLAGLALVLAGQGLRAAVIGLAYIRRGGRDRRIDADELVTGGLFAHCRNPLYVGNLLILTGLFVVHGSPWCLVPGILFFAGAYLAITLAEEDYLRGRFGAAYDEYVRRVPRFLPRLQGLRETLAGASFDWPKVIRKEYGATFAWFSLLMVILLREAWQREGAAALHATGLAIAAVWGAGLCGWAAARALKKQGALGGHYRQPAT
ncbi:MAG TPA: isoprenylcysteine carboxylmethyltransferase family protein [Candidatus Polarisedimenticolia bacterium]|nr:isoprenylcysteine carboxylmethyltransferase family protein [Candidatus Polarisedimenticolia bacterium]